MSLRTSGTLLFALGSCSYIAGVSATPEKGFFRGHSGRMLFASGNAHLFTSEHRRMLGTTLNNKVFTVHGGQNVKDQFQASSAVQFDAELKLSSDDVKSADAATHNFVVIGTDGKVVPAAFTYKGDAKFLYSTGRSWADVGTDKYIANEPQLQQFYLEDHTNIQDEYSTAVNELNNALSIASFNDLSTLRSYAADQRAQDLTNNKNARDDISNLFYSTTLKVSSAISSGDRHTKSAAASKARFDDSNANQQARDGLESEWSGYRDQASTDAANDRQTHRNEELQNREGISNGLSTQLFEKVTSTAVKISNADSTDDSNAVAGYSATHSTTRANLVSTAETARAARKTAAEQARALDSQNAANERDADKQTNMNARTSLDGNENTAREALSRAISIDEAKLDAFVHNQGAMQNVEDISNAIASGDNGKQNAMENLLSGYENDASNTRESHRSTVIKIYSTVEANTLKTMNDQSSATSRLLSIALSTEEAAATEYITGRTNEFDDSTAMSIIYETEVVLTGQYDLDTKFALSMAAGQTGLSNTVETARDTARNSASSARGADLTTNANARSGLSTDMSNSRDADATTNLQARTAISNGAATERAGVTVTENTARTNLNTAAVNFRAGLKTAASDSRTSISNGVKTKADDIENFEDGQNTADQTQMETNVGNWQTDATGYGFSVDHDAQGKRDSASETHSIARSKISGDQSTARSTNAKDESIARSKQGAANSVQFGALETEIENDSNAMENFLKNAPSTLNTMQEISNVIAKEDADSTTALQTVLTGYKDDESSAKETLRKQLDDQKAADVLARSRMLHILANTLGVSYTTLSTTAEQQADTTGYGFDDITIAHATSTAVALD